MAVARLPELSYQSRESLRTGTQYKNQKPDGDDLWTVVAMKTTTNEMNPKRNLMLDTLFIQSRSSWNFLVANNIVANDTQQ